MNNIAKEIKVILGHYGIECDVDMKEERGQEGYMIRGVISFDLPTRDAHLVSSYHEALKPFTSKIEDSPYYQELNEKVTALRKRVHELIKYENFYMLYKDLGNDND